MPDYHKAGLIAVKGGRLLLCRKKKNTARLILPGGKFEPGETAMECLRREISEELGDVQVYGVEYLGTYIDEAADGRQKTVQIELFRGEIVGEPAPHQEIKELVWFGEEDDRTQLAPSLVKQIVPDLVARGILPWHHE